MEGFQEVPLLRDRLFLVDLQRIREEREFRRCTTPPDGEDSVADSRVEHPDPFNYSFTADYDASRVERPELPRGEASSSLPNVSNPHSPPSTHQTPTRFTSVASAYQLRRPVTNPRTVVRRLPASSLRCVSRFQTETLRNLLDSNDFLRTSPVSNSETEPTFKSSFRSRDFSDLNPSNLLGEKNSPGLYLVVPQEASNEPSDGDFQYEKAPKIISRVLLGKPPISPHSMRKRGPTGPLRRAASPQRGLTLPLTGRDLSTPTFQNLLKPPSISAELEEMEEYNALYGDMQSMPSNQTLDALGGGGDTPLSDTPNLESLAISSSSSNSSALSNPRLEEMMAPIITEGPIPDYRVMQQVASAFKQSLSSGVNMKPLFVLSTDIISGRQAADFQSQADQWNDNFCLKQVIVPPATHSVKFAFATDPAFNMFSSDLYDTWMEHVTVKQAATIITKYFGDKKDAGSTIVENFSAIPIIFNYSDPEVERKTFAKLISLTTTYENTTALTPSQHAALIVTIEKKLKPDSQLKIDYMTARDADRKPNERWEHAFIRLTKCVGSVRLMVEKIANYGSITFDHVLALRNTDHVLQHGRSTSIPVPQVQSAYAAAVYGKQAGITNTVVPPPVPPSSVPLQLVLKRSASEGPVQLIPQPPCRSCGHAGHEVKICPVLFYTDANNELHQEWKDSRVGKVWQSFGFTAYDNDAKLPGYEVRYLNKPQDSFQPWMLRNVPNTSRSDYKRTRFEGDGEKPNTGRGGNHDPSLNAQFADSRRSRKLGNISSLPSILAATLTQLDVDSNFLSSWIFINQRSIIRNGVKEQTRTNPNQPQTPKRVMAKILLDTGSLPGDFISQDFVNKLQGHHYVYTSPDALTICSGLDNTCYIKDQVIDIGMTFVTHDLLIKTIFLTLRIIPNTIDLILGRATLKKFNFFSLTPFELGMPGVENSFKRIESLYSAGSIPLQPESIGINMRRPHSGIGILPVHIPNSDRVATCPDVGCASQSCASRSEPMRQDCNHVLTHGDERLRTYTLAHLSELAENTVTVARVETPSGIIISSDEIDNDKTDTFYPFMPDLVQINALPKRLEDFIDLLTIHGTESQVLAIKRLCLKYADIFSDTLARKAARLPPFKINIDRKEWECPRNRTAVRLQSVRKEREIKRAIDEMLRSGVIEESDAVYYSHPVIVQKTAELYRFCIDYRNLNKCTQASSYPLPNIRALFERIGHQKPTIFGVMDLTSGYHQAPMDEQSKVLTAFICFYGVYQFTRLPFGPRRAPSYFQEMMATIVLNGLMYTKCEMYLDDCIVFARGQEEFLERLERVFRRFRCFGLLLKAKKCRFGMTQIDYVGRRISADGLSMSQQKIESVLNFPKPMNLTSLRSLLGLANYFRNFVPFHSNIVEPLQRMITPQGKKKSLIEWTTKSEEAFFLIRQAISRCPLLHFLDEISPIELYTDASDYGVGGVLFQVVGFVKNPISFLSKSLSATQIKWSTIQKEAYAIYYCCKQLDSLLRDRTFKIFTDHKNLTFLSLDPSTMVNRWSMALQELDYTVSYITGPKNYLADALSRLCPNLSQLVIPDKSPRVEELDTVVLSALHEIAPVTDLQREVIEMCHNSMVGHGGISRTMLKLNSLDEEWLDMEAHVRDFIRNCACCQKMSVIKIPVHIHKYTTSTYRPFDTVNIDYVGPYPDNGYVLVMICSFTRWTELYWCSNNTAQIACECLLQFFGRFGAPSMIRSDRGSHFMNEIVREFLIRTGTPHNLTLAYSKQENAIVERVNKEVNRHLRAFTFDSTDLEAYKLCLPFVQRIINSSVHASTGASPASLLFGNQLNLDRGILIKFPEETQLPTKASKIIANMLLIQNKLNSMAINQLTIADDIHVSVNTKPRTVFEINSYVLALNPAGPESRLHCKWLGPFQVINFDKSEYTVLNLITKKTRAIHASQLKPFRFNPTQKSPSDTARRDYMEFFIEDIISHVGNKKAPSTMKFYIKWLNYDSAFNSWEPWKFLRATDQLHKYLRENNMNHVIPREFREKLPHPG